MSSRGPARRLASAVLLASAALAAAASLGCGKKGPPLPPLRFVPAPTKDLAVEQRGAQVLLSFTYPKTTPSGAALNGVNSVEVWELLRMVAPRSAALPPAAAPPSATAPGAPRPAAAAPPTAPPAAPSPAPTSAPAGATPPPPAAPPAAPAPAPPPAPTVPPTPPVGAATVPPPPADLPGGFPAVDPRELAGQAKLRVKLQGAEIGAATLGDKLVIALPLPEPLPASATPAGAPIGAQVTGSAAGAKPVAGAPTVPPPGSEQVHYYVVRTTGPKDDRSAFSNQVALVPKTPPSPPGEVKLKGAAEGVEVAWTDPAPPPPAGAKPILGFNIYRRDAKAKSFGPPLRAAIASARSVVDGTARFGESYIYSVTTIAEPNPLVESAIKSEVEIKYVDRFPPPAPGEVVALAEAGTVRVVWRASGAPDLAGYLVYRRQGAAGPFQKLIAAPVSDLQYLDGSVATGATYTYRVTAVDQSGNESPPGEAQTKVQ